MKVLGVISARGGSKGVPRKNVRPLAGRPLMTHMIENAQKAQLIDRLILTTEDDKIMEIGRACGIEIPFRRPAELANDKATGIDVSKHSMEAMDGLGYRADVICHPSNLVLPYCQDAMRTRSIENKVFTITANRIGVEKRGNLSLSFTGKSQITDPTGQVLVSAGERSESLKITEIDVSQARDKFVTPSNDLFKDRKVSLYKPLLRK